MDIQTLVVLLLLGRSISIMFILSVLNIQWRLLKRPIEPYIENFRKILFGLSLAILISNMIPVIIDIATLFTDIGRPAVVSFAGVIYSLSNSLTAAISSLLVWYLYYVATKENK